jgi:hypothetical protein
MASTFQTFTILATQPVSSAANTPAQITTSSLFVRSVLIEAHWENRDRVYIGSSSATTTKLLGHSLTPGESMQIRGDNFSSREVQFDLSQLWYATQRAGDRLVVSYFVDERG